MLIIPETNEIPVEPIVDSGIESVEGSLTIPLQRGITIKLVSCKICKLLNNYSNLFIHFLLVPKQIIFPKKTTSISLNSGSSSTAINAKG